MNENAIEVKNISKCFRIYPDKGYSLRDKLLFWKRNKYEKLQEKNSKKKHCNYCESVA